MTAQTVAYPYVCTYCWQRWPIDEPAALVVHLEKHEAAERLTREMARCEAGPDVQAPPE